MKQRSNELIPIADFFRLPEKSTFKISPNGEYVSYRAPHEGIMNLFVQQLTSTVAVRVTNSKTRDIGGYFWKGNRIVYALDPLGDDNYVLFAVDPDGSNQKSLTPLENVRAGLLDDLHGVRRMRTHILAQTNERNPQVFDPYLIDIETGLAEPQYDNSSENFEGWITDHDGVIRFASRTDGVSTVWFYRETQNAPFSEYMTVGFRDNWVPKFFTFDNNRCYVSSNLGGRDKSAIVEWDIEGKKEYRLIHAEKNHDVDDLEYSRARHVLTSVSYTGAKWEQVFLDATSRKIHEALLQHFPNQQVSIVSSSEKEDKRIVWVGSDRSSGRYYLHEDDSNRIDLLADRMPWLDPEQLAETQPISYTSRDGLTIHGYVTLPRNQEPKHLPMVVLVHGGPWARDAWGFNAEVQFLASRGYAVLQVNYRGSTGYGRSFWEASFKQWGRSMQADITDGVRWMVQQGLADAEKVAIYGGSYGGYATLAGLAYTPDVYACGIDYVGVSNLFTFLSTIPAYWQPFLNMLHEMVGDPNADSLLLREVSPAFHTDLIKSPLLIAQGTNDPRVLREDTDRMVVALRSQGNEVVYMVKEGEGHGFRSEVNRFEFYRRMEEFLNAHLGIKH